MKRVRLHKIASATYRLRLPEEVPVRFEAYPQTGDVLVVRALTENPAYPEIELTDGRPSKVCKGDILAGVVGSRQALRGYVGYAPVRLNPGDRLALLNRGGVVGRPLDAPADLGQPVCVEVLGTAMNGDRAYNIREVAIPPLWVLQNSAPIVLIVGTCMHVGKTETAARLIRELVRHGLKGSAAKLSGVAALRDLKEFEGAGAIRALSFLDAGYPSTVDADDWGPPFKGILEELNREKPDWIVVELGDGILGRYRVDEIVQDENLMQFVIGTIVCATDLTAAYGAREVLNRLGLIPTLFSGPVTDTVTGTEYIEQKFGIPAINAIKEGERLSRVFLNRLKRMGQKGSAFLSHQA